MSDIAIFGPGFEAFLWFGLYTIVFAVATLGVALARWGWRGPATATCLSLAAALLILLEDEGVIRVSTGTLRWLDRWGWAWGVVMALVWWWVAARLSRASPPGTGSAGGAAPPPRSPPPG